MEPCQTAEMEMRWKCSFSLISSLSRSARRAISDEPGLADWVTPQTYFTKERGEDDGVCVCECMCVCESLSVE